MTNKETTKAIKDELKAAGFDIKKIQEEEKERLKKLGYSDEQIDFLNDIIDVRFFNGRPSRIVLKDKTELYL